MARDVPRRHGRGDAERVRERERDFVQRGKVKVRQGKMAGYETSAFRERAGHTRCIAGDVNTRRDRARLPRDVRARARISFYFYRDKYFIRAARYCNARLRELQLFTDLTSLSLLLLAAMEISNEFI